MSEINEDTAAQHCLTNLATFSMTLPFLSFNGNHKQAIYFMQITTKHIFSPAVVSSYAEGFGFIC